MKGLVTWHMGLVVAWRLVVALLLGAVIAEQDLPLAEQCVALAERLLRLGL